MNSLNKFLAIHNMANDGMRLGQRFCNYYIKQPYPELFYNTDYRTTVRMIVDWLNQYNYTEELPIRID